MRVDDFDYHLPTELIAQRPLEHRDQSRLLLLERSTGGVEDRVFRELPQLLRGDELLVINNTRVLPARLFGRRAGVFSQRPSRKTKAEHLHGQVEIFLTRKIEGDTWEALVRPGRKLPVGERIILGVGENEDLEAEILTRGQLGIRTVRFASKNGQSVSENIQRLGHVPLPPYIDRPDEASDHERYQTVFAQKPGAVAAPTAGLHFTSEILEKIRARGCEICEVTLAVGLGTFQPIHSETLEEHKIHTEAYEISEAAAAKINAAKKRGGRFLPLALQWYGRWKTQRGDLQNLPGKPRCFRVQPKHAFSSCQATHFALSTCCLQISICQNRRFWHWSHRLRAGKRFLRRTGMQWKNNTGFTAMAIAC